MKTKLIKHKIFATTVTLFIGLCSYSQEVEEHVSPIFNIEQLAGIGTDQTIYTTTLNLDGKCKVQVEQYLSSQPSIRTFQVSSHQIVIDWVEATQANIIFFYEKLEFSLIFPLATN